MTNFLEILFYFCKIILIWQKCFLETLFEYYFLNIIVNVNFFSDLELNITASTTLRYCNKMGGAMIYLGLWSPLAYKFCFEKFVKPSALSSEENYTLLVQVILNQLWKGIWNPE